MGRACTFSTASRPLEVRQVHGDAPVEPARAQQRLVQNLRPVGGAQHHDALVGVKPVHFRNSWLRACSRSSLTLMPEVSRFLPMASISSMNTITGGLFVGLLEQVPHPGRARAHKHLHKGGAGHEEEGHPRFRPGHRLGDQRLAGARRAYQQRALGQLRPDGAVLVRLMQKIHQVRSARPWPRPAPPHR